MATTKKVGGAKFVDRDLGYERIKKTLAQARRPYVVVGVLGEHNEEREGGVTTAEIATMHEFGGEDDMPPERSFLRSTVDAKQEGYVAALKKLADLVLLGKMSMEVALGRFGLLVVRDVKQTIRDRIAPELAPATLARKGDGKDIPLIDTAQLINSIDHRVENT